ncbi:type II toxin-antitoxin system RelE/ParE family toxin [Streptomyces sp. NBC_00433]
MKYALRFTETARRQLRAIDRTAAMTILTALTPLGDDPYRSDANVRKLSGPHDLFRLRVGDFRVAYRVDDGELVVLVVRVGHRRDVYRNL